MEGVAEGVGSSKWLNRLYAFDVTEVLQASDGRRCTCEQPESRAKRGEAESDGEPRTANREPRTANREPRTANREARKMRGRAW